MTIRVDSFQSIGMKKRGDPPTYSLYRKVLSTPAGPQRMITGETVNVPYPLALWEQVPGAPMFATLEEAVAHWPGEPVSAYAVA
jgi:hypothetical protein